MRSLLSPLAAAAMLIAAPILAQDLGPQVSGDARMGFVYERPPSWAQRETGLRMTSRARLKFQFTGETDGGVRFGGEFRLDSDRDRPPVHRPRIGE